MEKRLLFFLSFHPIIKRGRRLTGRIIIMASLLQGTQKNLYFPFEAGEGKIHLDTPAPFEYIFVVFYVFFSAHEKYNYDTGTKMKGAGDELSVEKVALESRELFFFAFARRSLLVIYSLYIPDAR